MSPSRTLLLLTALGLLSSCAAPTEDAPKAEVAVYGSMAAGQVLFQPEASCFKPAASLSSPGELSGRWSEPNRESPLTVIPSREKDADHFEHFLLRAGGDTYDFQASYGTFLIFGCDVDGDHADEIFLEHGWGRGTCVYERCLKVLKSFNGGLASILAVRLSGYLMNDEGLDPVPWQTRYFLRPGRSGKLDVVLTLVPPVRVPTLTGSLDDQVVLQHPRYVLEYQPVHKAYRIRDEQFAPVDAKGERR